MNCEYFEQLIENDTSVAADAGEQQRLFEHLQGCSACSAVAVKHQRYRALMQGAVGPALDSARAARLIRIAQQQTQASKYSFMRGVVAASALAVALLVGVNSLQGPSLQSSNTLVADYDWAQDVTIEITAPQDMENAQLVLQLPADISIEGYEYASEVVWPIDLKQGRNTVVLPVILDELAQFSEHLWLPASLIYNNKQKDFELDLSMEATQTPSLGLLPAALAFKKLA